MSYVAQVKLIPSRSRDELEHAAIALLADLEKQGYLWAKPILTWTEESLLVVCSIPREDTLAEHHANELIREDLAKLAPLTSHPLSWTVQGSTSSARSTREGWANCPSFYLMTTLLDRDTPLFAGDDGEPVPLYLLPLDISTRERLTFWMRSYAAHEQIWFDSHDLEVPAYDQLARIDSGLSLEGRSICATVEAATRVPCYFFLRYHYTRPPNRRRECPECASPWTVAQPFDQPGLARFPLRCERCRVVSEEGVDTSQLADTDATD